MLLNTVPSCTASDQLCHGRLTRWVNVRGSEWDGMSYMNFQVDRGLIFGLFHQSVCYVLLGSMDQDTPTFNGSGNLTDSKNALATWDPIAQDAI